MFTSKYYHPRMRQAGIIVPGCARYATSSGSGKSQGMTQAMTMVNRICVVTVLGLSALPASAQTLQSQLANCLAIPGVLQRLACYDGVAKGAGVTPHAAVPAATPAPTMTAPARTAGTAAALAAPPVAAAPVMATAAAPSFGSEKLAHPPADPAKPSQITADISSITFNPFGKFTVTLANGQVWRQLDGDSDTVRPHKGLQGVRISQALMGSYDLQFNDSSRVYKVTRVR